MGRERRVTGRKDVTITLAFKIWLGRSRCRAAWPSVRVTSITRVAQLSERNQLNRMCRRRLHCFMSSNLVGLHATDIDQRVVKTDHGASSSRTEPEELGGAVELV